MYCMDIGNRMEKTKSTILGPSLNFNFHTLEIRFVKNYDAHSICSKRCSAEGFGTFVDYDGHCKSLHVS